MAGEDAKTTFTIAFEGDVTGIDQIKAALDGLRASIKKDTAALGALQREMQNLRGTAEVARWEALPRDIRSAESEVAKLSAKMQKLQSDFAKAPEGKREGIFAAGLQAQGQLDAATKRLGALRGEQKRLGDTAPVKLFEDMRQASEKLKSDFAKAPESKKEGIFAAGLQTQQELNRTREKLVTLRGEQKRLGHISL